ncbi:hypothetical protein M407DRAFT_240978 [Tulasnella calospora MUT 4182]|uniref:Uncharacterized protein n=1 Tax=Tulasnella calospora MUT 4182 TaxID=1051891 RepID=A0A0C3QVF8_9AGAM|nr:hypothetical protein M407DRAFT_240978 [Tulasnella calospora MUT 4182]
MDTPGVLVAASYSQIKAQYPNEGRRRWKLRAVEEVWKASSIMEIEAKSEEIKKTQGVPALPWLVDKDPLDLDDGPSEGRVVNAKGVIVRTDFSNDAAWDEFVSRVKEAEKEGVSGLTTGPGEEEGDGEEGEDSESSSDEEEEGDAQQMDVDPTGGGEGSAPRAEVPSVFHIINPAPTDPLRALVENASNIRLLRLFNDVQIVPAPPKPRPPQGDLFSGMPKKKQQQPQPEKPPSNRLVDKFGWKEVYPGRILWVFDAESNATGGVRVVNSGDDSAYGSSTGDSWRARAAHIWELQVNMDSGALKIDFGGEDRWTGKERLRNYEEGAR